MILSSPSIETFYSHIFTESDTGRIFPISCDTMPRPVTVTNGSFLPNRPQPPKPVQADGFSYNDRIMYRGIFRYTYDQIKNFLLPELVQGEEKQRIFRKEANLLCDRSWLVAQLKLYGFNFDTEDTNDGLRNRLRSLVLAHQEVDDFIIPKNLREIETRLERRYHFQLLEYRDDVRKYEAEIANAKEKREAEIAFAALPAFEQANKDPQKFISRHYLDQHGKPQRTKSPEPIVLIGCFSPGAREALYKAIDQVPGLHKYGLSIHQTDLVAIAWNEAQTYQVTRQGIPNLQKREQVRLQRLESRLLVKEAHARTLLFNTESKAAGSSGRLDSARLESYVGRYSLEFSPLEGSSRRKEQLPSDFETLDIFIHPKERSLVGVFQFNILGGCIYMRLPEQPFVFDIFGYPILASDKSSIFGFLNDNWKTLDKSSENGAETNANGKRPASNYSPVAKKSKTEVNQGSVLIPLTWHGVWENGQISYDDSPYAGSLNFYNNLSSFEGHLCIGGRSSLDPLDEIDDIYFSGLKISNTPKLRDFDWTHIK
ncbi:hypothetical protein BT63DRAFT_479967 [Microthyrium microscopicum]|uniref:Uncharacterized protein n=1 Tax=Microthyrium microscopicum TaxID=703497 RepID=A0A6A6UAE0_9PEZI|nr:hypothetical protein BT63DRAFT_479967 [Microthyrium microscopicum]